MSSETDDRAAYDKWFRAAVQAALDDPRPSIPNEVVEAEFRVRREKAREKALRRLREKDAGEPG